MDPINYLAMVPQQDFLRDIQGGLQLGAGFQEAQQLRDARDLALQQKQVAMQRQQQYQSDVSAALAAPRDQQAQLFSALALRNPDQYEAITKSWGAMSAEQQKSELRDTLTIASALHADRPDLALSQIDERITAAKNSNQPTQDLEALRGLVEKDPKAAYGQVLHIASVLPGGKDVLANLQSIGKEQRDAAEADVTVAGKQADNAQKSLGIVGQTLGSLQGKSAKPAQAYTAIKSLQSRGLLSADEAAALRDSVPTDPKALDAWFGQQRDAGIKADDQKKYTTPDANTVANNDRIAAEGAANRANQVRVTQMVSDREANGGDDAASFSQQAIDNAAARYNIDGTLPPMGMGKAAAAGRTKILNRAAELKAGIDPEQQRRDQLNNKGDVGARNAAVRSFATGKDGQAVQAANTALNHLDTIRQLATAQKNKDWRAFNQVSRAIGAQFGQAAPTDMKAALIMVAPEISKAVVGVSGTGHEREQAVDALNPNNSLEQIISGTGVMQELFGGRLTEARRTYERTTGKKDFRDTMLSPAAQRVIDRAHDGGKGGPAVGAVEAGKDGARYRFKGGDPSQPTSWERM
jgi:hypothetical protein